MACSPASQTVISSPGTQMRYVPAQQLFRGKTSDGKKFVSPTNAERDGVFKSFIGSKLVVVDSLSGYWGLIEDKGKPWDFVGGTSEQDETPEETLYREVWEECQINLTAMDKSRITYIGPSEERSKTFFARSFIFVAKFPEHHEIYGKLKFFDPKSTDWQNQQFQNWVSRIANFVSSRIVQYGDDVLIPKAVNVRAGTSPVDHFDRRMPKRGETIMTESGSTTWSGGGILKRHLCGAEERTPSPDYEEWDAPPMTPDEYKKYLEEDSIPVKKKKNRNSYEKSSSKHWRTKAEKHPDKG